MVLWYDRREHENTARLAQWNKRTTDKGADWWPIPEAAAVQLLGAIQGKIVLPGDPEFGEQYWGPYYPALQMVKAKYDPHNLFRFPQSIIPAEVWQNGSADPDTYKHPAIDEPIVPERTVIKVMANTVRLTSACANGLEI